MYIDIHAHLNFAEYKNDIKNVLERSFHAGVKTIINIGSNYQTSLRAIKLVQQYDSNNTNKKNVIPSEVEESRDPSASLRFAQDDNGKVKLYSVVGCHPIHLLSDITETAIFDGKEYKFTTKKEKFNSDRYQKLIDENRDVIVGVGETGLDFYRLDNKNKSQNPNNKLQINSKSQITNFKRIQKQVFKEHIKLAGKNNLPLVLHCRGAKNDPYGVYDEMLEILKNDANLRMYANAANKLITSEVKSSDTSGVVNRGVIHCFGGNLDQAREFIKLGFYIGVNGIVTFKNAKELQSIVKEIPLDKILLETDCPFLAPDPHRGKRNEPAYIPIIAQKIAELKNIDISKVEKQTTNNTKKLFNI